jgi:hypothetical protein
MIRMIVIILSEIPVRRQNPGSPTRMDCFVDVESTCAPAWQLCFSLSCLPLPEQTKGASLSGTYEARFIHAHIGDGRDATRVTDSSAETRV